MEQIIKTAQVCLLVTVFILVYCVTVLLLPLLPQHTDSANIPNNKAEAKPSKRTEKLWQPPDSAALPIDEKGKIIRYGRELIVHTAKYLGPKGIISSISNGINCQSCHLNAGTKPFGNNFSAVTSLYPKFRARSGALESIEKRVNDCLERSLNGKPLDKNSTEMQAFIAYFEWLGSDVPKGIAPHGAGVSDLPFLDKPASVEKGKLVFEEKCKLCHGPQGEGKASPDEVEWIYPPLWGDKSFNTAAGIYRLYNFARYVSTNMPLGSTYDKPMLTTEEAWDVSAYIISMPRPIKNFPEDWPDITAKPFDHPFGPYADTFPELQHKYGPFTAMKGAQKKK